MATRSRIAIENPDGTVTSIYCHWDGYPEGVGGTLITHYTQPEKVKALIALGSLSYVELNLAPEPGVEHTFMNPAKRVTVAYHRDRGEPFEQEQHANAEEFFNGDIEEFGYLFQNGEWLFAFAYSDGKEPRSLASFLNGVVS